MCAVRQNALFYQKAIYLQWTSIGLFQNLIFYNALVVSMDMNCFLTVGLCGNVYTVQVGIGQTSQEWIWGNHILINSLYLSPLHLGFYGLKSLFIWKICFLFHKSCHSVYYYLCIHSYLSSLFLSNGHGVYLDEKIGNK